MNLQVQAQAVFTLRRPSGGLESSFASDRLHTLHPPGFQLSPLGYVLLVHGYNNSHKQARASYARFRWWLGRAAANPRVLELHWPGNSVNWKYLPRLSMALGAASYWRQPDMAVKCGRTLASWLERAPNGARFVLVGHSMGCRLILEALRNLQTGERRRRIAGVCLMAAAVPIRMVERHDLGPVPRDRARWRVLFSRGDNVLKGAFPIGQAAAFDSFFSRAVGYTGEPKVRWSAVGKCEEMHEPWNYRENYYNHGWYWPGGQGEGQTVVQGGAEPLLPIKAPSTNSGGSATAVAELLGGVIERNFQKRAVPLGRAVTHDREFWARSIGET